MNLYIWLFTNLFNSFISTIYYLNESAKDPRNYISILNVFICYLIISTSGCQWELSMVTISCTNVEF